MRHRARKLAVQAIYQWQLAATPWSELEKSFFTAVNIKKIDLEYLRFLLFNVINHVNDIDAMIIPILDRSLDDLNPVELAILRLAVCELLYQKDVPYKVVINEALELEKVFGSTDGFKYVNAILDKIRTKV